MASYPSRRSSQFSLVPPPQPSDRVLRARHIAAAGKSYVLFAEDNDMLAGDCLVYTVVYTQLQLNLLTVKRDYGNVLVSPIGSQVRHESFKYKITARVEVFGYCLEA